MKPNLNHVSAVKLLHLITITNFLLPSDDDASIRFTPSNGHQKHFITCDKAYEVRSRQIRTFKASLVLEALMVGLKSYLLLTETDMAEPNFFPFKRPLLLAATLFNIFFNVTISIVSRPLFLEFDRSLHLSESIMNSTLVNSSLEEG